MSKHNGDQELEHLFERARNDFKATADYRLIEEQAQQAEDLCKQMLRPEELQYMQAVIELEAKKRKWAEEFFYKKGHQDCVGLFSALGLL